MHVTAWDEWCMSGALVILSKLLSNIPNVTILRPDLKHRNIFFSQAKSFQWFNIRPDSMQTHALYRVAHKNGTANFPQYVDAINDIRVWGNFSWEKWYQDQQFWFSRLFSRALFVRQCRVQNLSLFRLNYRREWMPFRLATVVSSNPFNFVK